MSGEEARTPNVHRCSWRSKIWACVHLGLIVHSVSLLPLQATDLQVCKVFAYYRIMWYIKPDQSLSTLLRRDSILFSHSLLYCGESWCCLITVCSTVASFNTVWLLFALLRIDLKLFGCFPYYCREVQCCLAAFHSIVAAFYFNATARQNLLVLGFFHHTYPHPHTHTHTSGSLFFLLSSLSLSFLSASSSSCTKLFAGSSNDSTPERMVGIMYSYK